MGTGRRFQGGGRTGASAAHRQTRRPPGVGGVAAGLLLAFFGQDGGAAAAAHLAAAPLFDGERTSIAGEGLLNNWGGLMSKGNLARIALDGSVARSGDYSLRADLNLPAGGFGFFQAFSSAPTSTVAARQTRDLTRYQGLEAYVRNSASQPLQLKLELKDYRDSLSHQAYRTFSIPAGTGWTRIAAPLDLSAGWTTAGAPDLKRTYVLSFVAVGGANPVNGSLYLDDLALIEPGDPLNEASPSLPQLAEQLARRQWTGMWDGRNRATGLIYNSSHDADLAALNTTAGVLWTLPSAVRRGWVAPAEAQAWVGQLTESIDRNRNQTSLLPSRFLDAATAAPRGSGEESSIDAAFLALALRQYQAQPGLDATLQAKIDQAANRFQFNAFSSGGRWRMAFFPSSGFLPASYDGYTNEGKVVSLAASLGNDHYVPLDSNWNGDTLRVRASLVNSHDAHLVHALTDFRAPFEQALLNLFVDTRDRGVDDYPDRALAANPWRNYVRYQREAAARLEALGRGLLLQPDAGQGGGTAGYQQYSLYQDFGQSDLFMPWSVALALLGEAPRAEEALRRLMDDPLLGPLGLADSARWKTGAPLPEAVPAYADNWNMALSTMALLEWLDGPQSASRFFARLPQVRSELDRVFVDGDLDADGVADAADYALWAAGFGRAAGAVPSQGDADGDGSVAGADLLRWQRGFGLGAGSVPGLPIPEPGAAALAVGCLSAAAGARRSVRSLVAATLAVAAVAASERAAVAAPLPAVPLPAASLPAESPGRDDAAFLELVAQRTFRWFWDMTPAETGLVPDRAPSRSFSSIAAIGFGLTAYGIGCERGYVAREEAVARVLRTLEFLAAAPQGPAAAGTAGYRGFFYHFLDSQTGARFGRNELSSIDTALLMLGVLFCEEYFDRDDADEARIRELATQLYRRVEWSWMQPRAPLVAMAWTPEDGFGPADYQGFDEALFLYVLALGSPDHPIAAEAWPAYVATYQWGEFEGQHYAQFGPLFGYQYAHCWIDPHQLQDDCFRRRGIDCWTHSRRATYAHFAYCQANPRGFVGYGRRLWGLTACDGPALARRPVAGREIAFERYMARGASARETVDDGTVAPCAAGGSLPFAPEIVIPALRAMADDFGSDVFGPYGFVDAFNPTFTWPDADIERGRVDPRRGWFDSDHLGIDQGPILLMIENYRSGLVWKTIRRSAAVAAGLRRAGFAYASPTSLLAPATAAD